MRCRSNAVLALSASVAVTLGLALVPSAATAHTGAGAAAVKVPKIKSVKLDLDVAGFVETRQFTDTTDVCNVGSTYTQTNTYNFETGNFVKTRLSYITLPGFDGPITVSRFSPAAGSALIKGKITGFRTTNLCPPHLPQPEPQPPNCVKTRGKTSVALTPAGKLEGNEDDPAPLEGNRMMVAVKRSGGAQDDLSCSGGIVAGLRGTDTGRAIVSTSLAPGTSLVLPTRLDSIKLFNLKFKRKGRRHQVNRDLLQRTIVVEGPCDSVSVTTYIGWKGGISPTVPLDEDGECWLTGKIVLSVRRSL